MEPASSTRRSTRARRTPSTEESISSIFDAANEAAEAHADDAPLIIPASLNAHPRVRDKILCTETRSNREKQAYLYLADNAFAQMEGASAEELQGMKRKAEEMRKKAEEAHLEHFGRPIRENPFASPGGD